MTGADGTAMGGAVTRGTASAPTGARPAWRSRHVLGLLSGLVLVAGCVVLLPATFLTRDFYAYPGGDISTLQSSPCGSG